MSSGPDYPRDEVRPDAPGATPADGLVVRRRPEPSAWSGWGKAIAALLVIGLLVFLIAQIFTGCLIPLPNELADQPSFGYVEPPRIMSPAEAIPFQGPVAIEAQGLPANPVAYSVESLARGENAFSIYCQLCHGEPGSGVPGEVGALFQPPPPDLGERVVDLPDGQIFVVITQGFGRMPALDWNLEEDGRWHVVNYLRSVTTGAPPEAAASATQRAALLFNLQCATCHGPTGRGALGPALYPSAFITEAAITDIAQIIIAGRTSRGMPSFSGYVSEEEAANMAEFLKLLQREGPAGIEETRRRLLESGVEAPGPPGTTTTTGPSAGQTTTTSAPAGQTTTTASPGTTTAPGGELISTGQQVFSQNCATCHGQEGTGGGIGPVLQGNQFIQQATDDDLRQLIEQGRAGTPMPPFAGRLTDEQITAAIALLRSWQSGSSSLDPRQLHPESGPRLAAREWALVANTLLRGVRYLPAQPALSRGEAPKVVLAQAGGGDLQEGLTLFSQNCATCHGQEGTGGGIGPVLQGNQFIQQATDGDLRQLIEQGRAGTPMPPFGGTLNAGQIGSLIQLLRSWQDGGGAGGTTTTAAGGTGTTTTAAGGTGTTAGGTESTAPGGVTTTTEPAGAPGGRADNVIEAEGCIELPFTHKAHVDRGVDCLFCHASARRGPAADLPPLQLCAGCHQWISTQTDQTQQVLDAYNNGTAVSWARVYNEPDFVYFNHRSHVVVAGVQCERCHGDVGALTIVRSPANDLNMGFCLVCHKVANYALYEDQPEAGIQGALWGEDLPEGRFLTDCDICHM